MPNDRNKYNPLPHPTQEMTQVTEYIYKRDIDMMMQVSSKAVELQAAVADQNEEIIEKLNKVIEQNEKSSSQKKEMETKIDKIVKSHEELARDVFRIQVLFISGFVGIILQIVSIFLKK